MKPGSPQQMPVNAQDLRRPRLARIRVRVGFRHAEGEQAQHHHAQSTMT